MKILIISTSFFPKITPRSFRTTELVKELCRQGHQVVLMTYYFPKHHDLLMQEYGFQIIDLGVKEFSPLKIRDKMPWNIINRGLNRLMNLFFEYPAIEIMFQVRKKLKSITHFDYLISIAVPHPTHWGVAWARTKKRPLADIWIADCGDPYMGNQFDSFKKVFYFKYFEKWFCRKADYITIPNIQMIINFYPEFKSKFREIPQGFNFSETKELLKPYKGNNKPTFAYTGSLIAEARDPRPLMDILIESEKDFTFFLFTKSTGLVKKHIQKANGKIVVKDYIAREKLIEFLSEMDFLVNISYNPTNQLPSKLIDYYLVNRPILNIANCNKPNKENILRFLEGDYSGKFEYNNIDQYQIENVVNKFLNIAIT